MSEVARPALIAAVVIVAILGAYVFRDQIMVLFFQAAFATGLMHNPCQCIVP